MRGPVGRGARGEAAGSPLSRGGRSEGSRGSFEGSPGAPPDGPQRVSNAGGPASPSPAAAHRAPRPSPASTAGSWSGSQSKTRSASGATASPRRDLTGRLDERRVGKRWFNTV